MASTLVELTANIVASHAAGKGMTSDDLLQEITKVFATLKQLDADGVVSTEPVAPEQTGPALTMKKAFQNDQVGCMICGKTGFKTLARHLKQAHNLKPREYRKMFNIPADQPLTAKNYSEARREAAASNNLAENLIKARAARAAKAATAAPKAKKAAKVPKAAKKKTAEA